MGHVLEQAATWLTLEQIDALIGEPRPLRQPFCGCQVMAGLAMMLFNTPSGSTRAWLVYDEAEPVVFRVAA